MPVFLCRQGAFDVAILDGADPGFDGGLCRCIQGHEFGNDGPCRPTEVGEPLQRLRALDAGADECLSGPASPRQS